MIKLQLNKVTKIYNKNIYATEELTFDVQDKEFAVLVGPSGCGPDIKITIDVIEPMGNGIYAHGRCGKMMLSARLPNGMHPNIGESTYSEDRYRKNLFFQYKQ